jgi:hypothetical protein
VRAGVGCGHGTSAIAMGRGLPGLAFRSLRLSRPVDSDGEGSARTVFEEAGYSRFRRAAETPLKVILEARP